MKYLILFSFLMIGCANMIICDRYCDETGNKCWKVCPAKAGFSFDETGHYKADPREIEGTCVPSDLQLPYEYKEHNEGSCP